MPIPQLPLALTWEILWAIPDTAELILSRDVEDTELLSQRKNLSRLSIPSHTAFQNPSFSLLLVAFFPGAVEQVLIRSSCMISEHVIMRPLTKVKHIASIDSTGTRQEGQEALMRELLKLSIRRHG
jgi:hypothetical protein